jgi:predicted nucleic acid-binding protein
MRYALDSNVILYAEGINDFARRDIANDLIIAIGDDPLIIPIQALGEVQLALILKAGFSKSKAFECVSKWIDDSTVQETSVEVFNSALAIATGHGLRIWDAIILASAAEAGAHYLFSEDMHEGFTWGSTEIVNPFAAQPKPIVEKLLGAFQR